MYIDLFAQYLIERQPEQLLRMCQSHLLREGSVHALESAASVNGCDSERKCVEHGAPASVDFGEAVVDVEDAASNGESGAKLILIEGLHEAIVSAGFEREQMVQSIGVWY